MERLLLEPEPVGDLRPKAATLIARLESTGKIVVRSHQPLVDGARELLARGFDPATPLTMRHAGKAYSKWTYEEGESTPLQRRQWKPRPAMPIAAGPVGQKSGVSDVPAATLPAGPEIASTVNQRGGNEGGLPGGE